MSQFAAAATPSQSQHQPRQQSPSQPPPLSSPAPSSQAANASLNSAQHKRVYQACIPCRRRKVRCDLGSVDNPNDPPCVRCRRESKECYFSATRRKRKQEDEPEEDYVIRNGRKRHYVGASPPPPPIDRQSYNSVPLTPGGSTGRREPLRRPENNRHDSMGSFSDIGEESNAQLENLEAQSVMRSAVYGPNDALDLLYKAATDHPQALESLNRRSESIATTVQPSQVLAPPIRAVSKEQPYEGHGPPRVTSKSAEPIDPRLLPSGSVSGSNQAAQKEAIEKRLDVHDEPGYEDALKAWGRFRFVRAGWFTREEAIKYITYYYEFLSPLTPISPPTFRSPGTHLTLLTEEPILTVTLLTISSRYYQITSTGGHCRSHAIHEELWRYLRRMIERCLWGQEAFGGGFCGSGAEEQTSSTAPSRGMRKGSLRTLGTIESLMILTEWHPRALHFPPEEAIDELMLPFYDTPSNISTDEDGNLRPGGVGGRRIEGWLEPAWRSDRMCWMLLSTALGLAYELGVFDDIDQLLATSNITRPEYEDEAYRTRAMRIKRLLLVYVTQLAGRLGWTNMVPESIRQADPTLSGIFRRPGSHEDTTPGTSNSVMSFTNYVPDVELDDQIIHCWVGISNAMHIGNERLFKTPKHTTDIIQSGRYTTVLKEFQPILGNWRRTFEKIRMPTFIRHILNIEFEYVRIYVNSLALQAVVERCTSHANHANGSAPGGASNGPTQLSPQTQNYYGALPLGSLGGFGAEDQEFVKEVVEGSRNLLRTVVDGLLPPGYLKHTPVRTYFRIISGAMFLLKTFALGAPKSDVEMSISLMDRTVEALRTCVVDDVHLGTRFGDLLESLTNRLRDRFKHAPTNGVMQGSKSPGYDMSRAPSVNGQANGVPADGTYVAPKAKEGPVAPDRSSTPLPLPISATPFDLNTGNFPYPTGSSSVLRPSTPAPAGTATDVPADNIFENADWNNPDDQMWYLPTGAAFFQNIGENSNVNVTMTDQGVHVGGLDLLDFMTMDASFNGSMDAPSF
ncbi:hypothetical protein BX600DRAFT_460333 [Xylariales sp. PMI_506]|nr:hypothetical protein BX600DRAFT_460333 [Xylariales sp. PMI_506]